MFEIDKFILRKGKLCKSITDDAESDLECNATDSSTSLVLIFMIQRKLQEQKTHQLLSQLNIIEMMHNCMGVESGGGPWGRHFSKKFTFHFPWKCFPKWPFLEEKLIHLPKFLMNFFYFFCFLVIHPKNVTFLGFHQFLVSFNTFLVFFYNSGLLSGPCHSTGPWGSVPLTPFHRLCIIAADQ